MRTWLRDRAELDADQLEGLLPTLDDQVIVDPTSAEDLASLAGLLRLSACVHGCDGDAVAKIRNAITNEQHTPPADKEKAAYARGHESEGAPITSPRRLKFPKNDDKEKETGAAPSARRKVRFSEHVHVVAVPAIELSSEERLRLKKERTDAKRAATGTTASRGGG